jgi:hypothetical protein
MNLHRGVRFSIVWSNELINPADQSGDANTTRTITLQRDSPPPVTEMEANKRLMPTQMTSVIQRRPHSLRLFLMVWSTAASDMVKPVTHKLKRWAMGYSTEVKTL